MAYTTINKPSDYFNTVLYTGNESTNAITGVGFQPDFCWIKNRDCSLDGTDDHKLWDSVRGATNALISNSTAAEFTQSGLDSFDSDGFTLGSHVGINRSGDACVAWNWLAGGTASSNTDGSTTSSVSVNTTAGFSIVSYAGNDTADSTIGHGLGVKPDFIIFKDRTATGRWHTYHSVLGATGHMRLDSTSAFNTATSFMNDTEPTSSVINLGTSAHVNGVSQDHIAYCFAEKKGFSKFGTYTGNGSADGPMVYTGFKPAFVIMKRTDTSASWFMKDNKRDPFNPVEQTLASDSASSEAGWGTGDDIDLLSNGFKMKDNSTYINASGGTYIYMAFAEHPFVSSTGTPTTAR
jgi:hypothetical protein